MKRQEGSAILCQLLYRDTARASQPDRKCPNWAQEWLPNPPVHHQTQQVMSMNPQKFWLIFLFHFGDHKELKLSAELVMNRKMVILQARSVLSAKYLPVNLLTTNNQVIKKLKLYLEVFRNGDGDFHVGSKE